MRLVALTGLPQAQDAVAEQLRAIAEARQLPLQLHVGVKSAVEAYAVRDMGGELWQCGPYAPERALVGYIDRVLPGTTAEEAKPQATYCLQEMLRKKTITGETA